MKRAIIFGDFGRGKIADVVSDVEPWLRQRLELVVCDTSQPVDVTSCEADLAVVFGGDGAMLYAARLLGGKQIPIVGVNMGKLGFLAEIHNREIKPAFEKIMSGEYRIMERMMPVLHPL